MKFLHYLGKLHTSPIFKQFEKKNKKAYLCAGFFVLDFELGKNLHHIDYYIPSNKKIATFALDKGIKMKISEAVTKKKPEKLEGKSKTDLDALKEIIEDEMKNRTVTEEIKKIIAILYSVEGKKLWHINCILSGFGILKVHLDDESSSVIEFEKTSLTDIMRKIG